MLEKKIIVRIKFSGLKYGEDRNNDTRKDRKMEKSDKATDH